VGTLLIKDIFSQALIGVRVFVNAMSKKLYFQYSSFFHLTPKLISDDLEDAEVLNSIRQEELLFEAKFVISIGHSLSDLIRCY